MSILSEFKEFAVKGNMMDLAIGVVIGAAFQKIINSLVNDILMPPIGFLMGGVDFNSMYVQLGGVPVTSLADARAAGSPVIAYGSFITTLIEFFFIALALFMMVKVMNRLRRKQERDDEKKLEAAVAVAK